MADGQYGCRERFVANTTPIYVVVNGARHGMRRTAAIIDKQLSAMARIEAEVATPRMKGGWNPAAVAEARHFYTELRSKWRAG